MKYKSTSLLLVAVALLTLSMLASPAAQAASTASGLHGTGIAPSSVRDIDGPWPVVRDIDGPWPVVRDIDGPWPVVRDIDGPWPIN